VNGDYVLGDDRFKDEIEAVVARRVRPGSGGPPRKKEGECKDSEKWSLFS
jgi:hypothetical protein